MNENTLLKQDIATCAYLSRGEKMKQTQQTSYA